MKKVKITIFLLFVFSATLVEGKRETLREAMERVSANGGKIAVVAYPYDVGFEAVEGKPAICPDGNGTDKVKVPDGYQKVAKAVAEAFRSGFDNKAIEWVEYNSLPEKKDGSAVASGLRDWWQTDYDIVIYTYIHIKYNPSLSGYSTSLEVNMSATIKEVIDEQEKMPMLKNFVNLGFVSTGSVNHEDAGCLNNIQQAMDIVAPPDALVDQAVAKAKEKLAKPIKKANKKYRKAMKKKK